MKAAASCGWGCHAGEGVAKVLGEPIRPPFLCGAPRCQRTPFEGIGKPEPLKHGMSGYWSRRITAEHQMAYKVEVDALFIAQLRYHY